LPIFRGFIAGLTIEGIADETVNCGVVSQNLPRCVDEVLTASNTPPDCRLRADEEAFGPNH
jgi:hypothetical protein